MNRTATQVGGATAVALPDADRPDRAFDLSTAGRCSPAGRAGQPIAGDFYDAYVLDEHRFLIAIGDVAGHGYGAGSRMRELRGAVRNLAPRTSSPAELLSALDGTLGLGDDDDIATVWVGIYDHDTSLLRYASAGHPPPILSEVGGPPRLLAAASAPPLGTDAVAAHVRTDEVLWPVGALLVAYTDGLVERRGRNLGDQINDVRELVGWIHATLDADATPRILAETLFNAVVPDPGSPLDDVCILVLRRETA
jgi:sigma-B regulation protein RsbU (phosphoserine phosphatase)